MSNESNENNQLDDMVSAYFEGIVPSTSESENQEEENSEENHEEEKQEDQNQSEEKVEPQEQEKSEEKQTSQEEKKPDFVLDEKGKWVLDKLSKGEDKEIYEILKNKYGHENLNEEEKVFAYLAEKNPHLTREDLLFKAAQEFGIGATPIEEDELTPDIKVYLKNQEINRKGLISEVNKYFSDKASQTEIPSLPNVLDLDEGYKEYLSFKAEQETIKELQAQEAEKNAKFEQETILKINTTAQGLDVLPIELKIDLDQGEFDLKSEFKLDDTKKKQLADYAIEYVPTQAELKAHQNQNGEFDMKGYMTSLANKLFDPQIRKALVKQAISQDREKFIDRELKNSTLRNNSDMQHSDIEVDFYSSAMDA